MGCTGWHGITTDRNTIGVGRTCAHTSLPPSLLFIKPASSSSFNIMSILNMFTEASLDNAKQYIGAEKRRKLNEIDEHQQGIDDCQQRFDQLEEHEYAITTEKKERREQYSEEDSEKGDSDDEAPNQESPSDDNGPEDQWSAVAAHMSKNPERGLKEAGEFLLPPLDNAAISSDGSSSVGDFDFNQEEWQQAMQGLFMGSDEFFPGVVFGIKENNKKCDWGSFMAVAQTLTICENVHYAFWFILKELGLFSDLYDDIESFIVRLNNVADKFALETILKDAFWSLLVQLWVAEKFVDKKSDFSFEFAENVKTAIRNRLSNCKQYPVDKSSIDEYHRQKF